MTISARPLSLQKRHALTISRGTNAGTVNLWVIVESEGIEGWGELAPSGVTGDSAETGQTDLLLLAPKLAGVSPWEREKIEMVLRTTPSVAVGLSGVGGGSALRAAIECACWDWLGKRANLPVWKLLGLDSKNIQETSVTVGINPPDVAAAQTREWQVRTGARHIKIKLGSPSGIDADRAQFEAIREAMLPKTVLRVDANGGWNLDDAQKMIPWLAERGVEYIEQPLAQGDEAHLARLRPAPVPIFADESIRVATDVVKLLGLVDGVNVKLAKCGGIQEALKIVTLARAHGLQTMLGCMSESSLGIAPAAHISPLFDHLDLDSQLNLVSDPFAPSLVWTDGKVVPGDGPGLGAHLPEHLPAPCSATLFSR
jgi:L-Ala-D/L-Glu epimerase